MNMLCRELLVFNRTRRFGQVRRIVKEAVDRFQLPFARVPEQVRPAVFHLTSHHTYTRVH